jgi:hypothetical protein
MQKRRTCRSPGLLRAFAALAAAVLSYGAGFSGMAAARLWQVGPQHRLKLPSAAAAVARNGDRVVIEPGRYIDCAVWRADHLTIAGSPDRTIVTGKACQGKALFVIDGNDVTIRGMTFTKARVPDGNGAGIRAEGGNLTIDDSRFIDNEDGLLAADSPNGAITIADSTFIGNGTCRKACAHGVYVGHIARLRIRGSRFFATKEGHHIKSRALRTELFGNDIEDGPRGTASFLVDVPNGGSLVMRRNMMEKGPNSENATAAVMIGEEGVTQPTREFVFTANRFVNDGTGTTIFVRNLTSAKAVLTGNTFAGKVVPLSGPGYVR